jgi:enterochelin esterase-like enzyme
MKTRLVILVLFSTFINGQTPKVSHGKIEHFENFKSIFVDARNIDVWLPDGYSADEKYAVLYMHDGQMLFDPNMTWNKQAWKVDEIAGKLINEGKIQKFIIVGIWNNGQKRHPEYYPQKAYTILSEKEKEFISDVLLKKSKITDNFKPISDSYLKFIVNELKPFIDKTFSTKSDRANTYIAGSSMGGLISLYSLCEYPKVFGAAACLSTHWTGIYQLDDNPIPESFFTYLKKKLPNPKNHRIYFDYGDKTLDSLYPTLQQKVDLIMKSKGYDENNWVTKYFPGEDHSEKAWHDRFHIPLAFLLKP